MLIVIGKWKTSTEPGRLIIHHRLVPRDTLHKSERYGVHTGTSSIMSIIVMIILHTPDQNKCKTVVTNA